MIEGNRMLVDLIDILSELEINLSYIVTDSNTSDYSVVNEKSSLANMKMVLDTLVKKTVAQKNCDEDIAVMDKKQMENNDFLFQTLVSTEDYLLKTKHLFDSIPDLEILKRQLITFQELLGDILYSTCQITNCNSKLPSGILVQDLLSLEKCYLSIWDRTVFISRKYKNKAETQHNLMHGRGATFKFQKLHETLQRGVKELLKVKLNIEHFLKVNFVELQLFPCEGIGMNNDCEKDLINKTTNLHFECTETSLMPSSTEFQNNEILKMDFPTYKEECSRRVEKQRSEYLEQEDLFKNETFPPQEVLFFPQGTILIQSTLGVRLKPSLPKIYSVDSIKEEKKDNTKDESIHRPNQLNLDKKEKSNKFQAVETRTNSQHSSLNKPVNNFSDASSAVQLSDVENTECKRKVRALLNYPKSQISGSTNICNATPLRIERSDIICSDHFWKTDLSTKKDLKVEWDNLKGSETTTKCNNSNDYEPKIQNKLYGQNYEERLFSPYQISGKITHTEQNQMVFDEESLIELFKYPGPCKDRNVLHPYQNNLYNIWPVTAEYIHVSRSKTIDNYNCSSESESSFSMTKKCEKSFFSLQLNKKHAEKKEYSGDLTVLDNPVEVCNEDSNYSLLNQSYIVYDENDTKLNKIGSQPSLSGKNKTNKNQNDCKLLKNVVKTNENILLTQFEDSRYHKYSQFSREHLDLSNLNEYNVNGNWNSYISIFTSKVGPSSRINHHRVIQRIINKFGGEPTKDNVHTLTSNRGPFRLFDLNGYPLTDCAGNVLKDPYGKAVVDLDSTGLPKGDIQVFDAEGNLSKDFKFDPTQRPKTNSVVMKLTDNFKRPLHLFDKYGRPLTDSHGKLLVNIHGRPLLRFDNFGRPTTDYRGGSLYTDNGCRWSFKNDRECFSNEHMNSAPLEKSTKNMFISENKKLNTNGFEKIISSKNDTVLEDNQSLRPDKTENLPQLNNNAADKWSAVEQILQHVQKKRKVEPTISQTNVIVNNETLTGNPLEKDFLKPIIYHDSASGNINSCGGPVDPLTLLYLKENNPNIKRMDDLLMNTILANYPHLIKNNFNSMVKNHCHTNLTTKIPKDTKQNTSYGKSLISDKCSQCTPQNIDQIQQENCNSCLNSYPTQTKCTINPQLMYNYGHCSTNLMSPTNQNHYQTFERKYTPSYLTFKNHDYIDNFDSRIQKCKVNYNDIKKVQGLDILNHRYKRWTDTSYTYSDINTTDLTQSDSPTLIFQSKNRSEWEKGRMENKNQNRSNYTEHLFNVDKDHGRKIINCEKEYLCSLVEDCKDGKSKSSLDKHILSLNILNQGDKHYEIKVADKLQTCTKVNNPTESSNRFEKRTETKAEAENNKSTDSLDQRKTLHLPPKKDKVDEHNNSTNKCTDSQFRFQSKENHLTANMLHKTQCHVDSNQTKNNLQHSGKIIKNQSPNFRQTASNHDKRQPQQRECTLVSFLGIPMKYVLKKFDSKKYPKPLIKSKNKGNTANIYHSEKRSNENKVKTLYDGSKLGKQFMSSSNESKPRKKIVLKTEKQLGLLAFKSKSCTDICDVKGIAMSYSGQGKSEAKHHLKDLPSTSHELRRISSMVMLSSDSLGQSIMVVNKRKCAKKHVSQRPRELKREYFYKPGLSGKTFRHSPEGSRDRKQSSGRHKKSIPFTDRNQKKEISLFRKVEPNRKYLVKVNK